MFHPPAPTPGGREKCPIHGTFVYSMVKIKRNYKDPKFTSTEVHYFVFIHINKQHQMKLGSKGVWRKFAMGSDLKLVRLFLPVELSQDVTMFGRQLKRQAKEG
jgi:hypothetical protein